MKYGIKYVDGFAVITDSENIFVEFNSFADQFEIESQNLKRNFRDWMRSDADEYLKVGNKSFYPLSLFEYILQTKNEKLNVDLDAIADAKIIIESNDVYATIENVKRITRSESKETFIPADEQIENEFIENDIMNDAPTVTPENHTDKPTPSRLRSFLLSPDSYLYATCGVILALLPFSISAFLKYATFGESGMYHAMSVCMAIVICFSWDFAILLFALKGNERVSNIGTAFQMIFISVHFEFLTAIIGENIEALIVKFSIIVYSAYLINRLADVASANE